MNENNSALETHLQQLVATGAGIFFVQENKTRPMASAHVLPDGQFWFCELWPDSDFAQHWVPQARIEQDNAGNLNLYNFGPLVATVSPLEPHERSEAQWDRWVDPADTEAAGGREFARLLESQALKGDH